MAICERCGLTWYTWVLVRRPDLKPTFVCDECKRALDNDREEQVEGKPL